jgi:hypothetical protein
MPAKHPSRFGKGGDPPWRDLLDNGMPAFKTGQQQSGQFHLLPRELSFWGLTTLASEPKQPWSRIAIKRLAGGHGFDFTNIFSNPGLADPTRPVAT